MIRPSKKYIDYCKAIDSLYNLGFIHEMKMTQEKFDALTVEQQNARISALSQLKDPSQYALTGDERGTRIDRALFDRIQTQRSKFLKKYPKMANTFNGKALLDYFPEFDIKKLTPDTDIGYVGKTPQYMVKLVREGLLVELTKVAQNPLNVPNNINGALLNDIKIMNALAKQKYNDFIVFVNNMSDDDLMSMVAKTNGLEVVMEQVDIYYDRTVTPDMARGVLQDKVQERVDYIDACMSHRW